jgi:hypothetical protein
MKGLFFIASGGTAAAAAKSQHFDSIISLNFDLQ